MAERPPEPSSAARRLLREFRMSESPTVADRDRGWSALSQRLHAPAPDEVAASNGRYYAKAVAVTVALAAGLLLAVKLVGLGVTTLADRERAPVMEAPYHGGVESEGGTAVAAVPEAAPRQAKARRSEPASQAESGQAAAAETIASASGQELSVAPASTRRVDAPRARATRPTASDDSAEAELAIIKRADEAKRKGDTATALAELGRHAERFPHGLLADERRVLHAEVLCAAGRRAEAREEIRRFLVSRAGSASAGRMRNACPEATP